MAASGDGVSLDALNKLIAQWGTLVAGLGALAAGIGAIWTPLTSFNPAAWSYKEFILALIAIALVVFVAVRTRSAHLARLIDPEALRLDPHAPDELVGRKKDLEKFLSVLSNKLVFLVSESGCGKTALLQAGVVAGSEFNAKFLPIYVDMSPLDWEDGPLRELREGFLKALSADDRAKLLLDAQSGQKRYVDVFAEFYRQTQRRPLLLLDQFDDFQAQQRYRDQFLPSETRVWRTAEAVARDNSFWRVIRQCLQSDALTVVVACREDAAAGLESFRFSPDVPQFDLPRLEPGFVRQIIDRLTERPADKPQIIADPERGWTALRDRMVDELEARGQVLPQQLKVVLRGLSTLRRLTPSAYARAGRAAGLEAQFVTGALQRAARSSGLTEAQALQLVLPLVDRTRQPPDKAQPRSERELAKMAGLPEVKADVALERLKADEILRPRETSDNAGAAWQLDHAYLASPILRIERERDHWRRLLTDRATAFADASLMKKWPALLPVGLQTQLLAARLRGQFRYDAQRAYATASAMRVLPAVGGIAIVAGLGWEAMEWDSAPRIENEFADMFGNNRELSDDAAKGLSELSSLGWVGRWRVGHDIFTDTPFAAAFASGPSSYPARPGPTGPVAPGSDRRFASDGGGPA